MEENRMQRCALLIATLMLLLLPSLASAQVFSFGFGFRGYYPGYRGYYYGGPVYGAYYAPGYVYPPPVTYVPAPVVTGEPAGNPARVTVLLPDANAELLIQGQHMNSVGKVRTFSSQALQPGREYTYNLIMHTPVGGQLIEDSRQVHIRAGSIVTVDFTKPNVETFPAVPPEPRRAVPAPATLPP
jgi:uncharacterized protein (TIGR03000 family)